MTFGLGPDVAQTAPAAASTQTVKGRPLLTGDILGAMLLQALRAVSLSVTDFTQPGDGIGNVGYGR